MLREFSVNFGNFLLSISDALDLADASIASHQMRTAFIAWQISKQASLPQERIENLYIASLFHDIGALALEEKVKIHDPECIDVDQHCILGEALFRTSYLFSPAKNIVRYHHTPWHQHDPSAVTADVFDSQIVNLADYVERNIDRSKNILLQTDRIKQKVKSLSGDIFNDEIVDLFIDVSIGEDFWLDLTSSRLYSILLHAGPLRQVEIGEDDIFSVSILFRNIIDFKSRFTATHSTGVAECAALLSRAMGFTEKEGRKIEIAGYLHDIGKLSIPSFILEKPGKLTRDEFLIMKQHTYFTYTILNTVGGLEDIAEWAGFHHEKLDGQGYPFRVSAEKISTGSRIMAVADIFTALAEDRPYRKGLEKNKIIEIIISQVESNQLDRKVVGILLENIDDISEKIKQKQSASRELFERYFSVTGNIPPNNKNSAIRKIENVC